MRTPQSQQPETGQALIESLVAAPIIILTLFLCFPVLALFLFRIELCRLTEKIATCHLAQIRVLDCRLSAQDRVTKLLRIGGFENEHIQISYSKPFARLHLDAHWSKLHLSWTFKEKSPLEEELFR